MAFFLEAFIGGMLSGVMYSLVALGYVLIFKSSGVFNFAQGAMVLFSALTFVRLIEMQLPFWLALLLTLVIMIVLAVAIERVVLRPLVNQPLIILFMATIGLNFFLEGLAQGIWDNQVHGLDIGIDDVPIASLASATGILISTFEIMAALIAGALVLGLSLFFHRTRIGRALRAVSDDHQAALSVGIPLHHIWAITWAASGIVALVAGMLWGSRLGVQFSLSLITLKALPVLILGGFNSIIGVIVGGLIIGSTEKVAEVFLSRYLGSGIESFFPYLLAMGCLIFRPYGLFGDEIIERV